MGNLNKNSASSFNFKKVEIITRDGESYRLAGNYVLGFTYYELEKYEEARVELTRLRAQFPNSSVATLAQQRLERMSREGN